MQHTGKFAKSYRFSIAAKLENGALDFIEATTVANMRKNKLPLLKQADEALARLRLLFRLKGGAPLFVFLSAKSPDARFEY